MGCSRLHSQLHRFPLDGMKNSATCNSVERGEKFPFILDTAFFNWRWEGGVLCASLNFLFHKLLPFTSICTNATVRNVRPKKVDHGGKDKKPRINDKNNYTFPVQKKPAFRILSYII